jgi:PKD repeat protein
LSAPGLKRREAYLEKLLAEEWAAIIPCWQLAQVFMPVFAAEEGFIVTRLSWVVLLGICGAVSAADAVKVEGVPLIFGGNTYGQCDVPSGLCNVTAIAVKNHVVALKNDGTVVAWGRNTAGQCNVPEGLSGVIAVAVGAEHSLALKSDGTVVAWGGNTSGECDVPMGLSGVVAIAAGYSGASIDGDLLLYGHSVALKSDGTVVCWGANLDRESNPPPDLTGVVGIATRGSICAALKSDGSVVEWGYNYSGESTVPGGLVGVTAVSVGDFHTVVLRSDGTVVAWGQNGSGQSEVPVGLDNVVAIAAGAYYSMALKGDGSVVAWGSNAKGQCDMPVGVQGISAVSAGFNNTAILHSGTPPTARFTCSEVAGFVGVPLAFDATFSTDPENQLKAYAWDFGDGSPVGSEKVMSKTYNAEGTYHVTLTIRDGDGLTASTRRDIVVLPASEVGLFNGFVNYKAKWNRGAQNTDTLSVDANVNVGDATVGKDTAVALEIAGVRFTGALDGKLRDSSKSNCKWQVKANTRGQSFGEVRLKVTVKKASLGLGFNTAGAVVNPDPHDLTQIDIPVHLEVAGKVFEVPVPSEFKFSADGKKASGGGEGP